MKDTKKDSFEKPKLSDFFDFLQLLFSFELSKNPSKHANGISGYHSHENDSGADCVKLNLFHILNLFDLTTEI